MEGNWKATLAHWDGGEQSGISSRALARELSGETGQKRVEMCTLRMLRARPKKNVKEAHGKRSKKYIARDWREKQGKR